MRRTLITLALSALAIAGPARGATPVEVDTAIKKAIESLYARQQNGTWETVPAPQGDGHDSPEGGQWGGLTGVVTYSLLAAGEKSTDPRITSAVAFLEQAKLRGVYAIGMRAQVWPFLPPSKAVSDAARRDAKLLLDSVKSKGDARGMWYYFVDQPQDERGDHSASQIGLLGIWACQEVGAEIPDKFWQLEDSAWRQHQLPEGGWAYVYNDKGAWGNPTLSMTCAGMASLYLTQDQLKRGQTTCVGNPKDPQMTKGMAWVGAQFPKNNDFNNPNPHAFFPGGPGRPFYMLYGLSRLGVYSGYRYFADIDWFQSGADFLIKEQRPDGGWGGSTWETALGLLFLSRGRAPVAINKLDYAGATATASTDSAPWNQRPRDAANLVHYMSKQMERLFNWQIVDLGSNPLDWMEAPVLYLSGSDDLKFSKEQQDKLRAYVEAGGMIVGNADCGNIKFTTAFKKLGTALFPADEFRELPADHVLYANQLFPRKKWKTKLNLQGLSNGARELMLLYTDADPAKAWQLQNSVSKSEAFESMTDVYLYNAGPGAGRNKGDTPVVKVDPAKTTDRTIKLARLQYSSNWDPEPGGWRRLSAVMHNEQKIDLQPTAIELGKGKLDQSFAVAHLTGTTKFALTADGRKELKAFVDGGGLLIIDAAGGNGEFASSVESELGQIFPDAKPAPLAPENAVLHTPIDLTKIDYRPFAKRSNGNNAGPRLNGIERNGRLAVVFTPVDLSVGLVGTGVDGINGYDPKTATSLMIDLVSSAKNSK